jgi:hypothetical protein
MKTAVLTFLAVSQVRTELRSGRSTAKPVIDAHTRKPTEPAELFISRLHAWVREDGRQIRFDLSRDFRMYYPGWLGRRAIVAAVKAYRRQVTA